MDWWQKREIERELAQQLNAAQEAFRLANLRLRAAIGSAKDLPASDSQLNIEQLHRNCAQAYADWMAALDRFTTFVKRGTISGMSKATCGNPQPPAGNP